MSRHTFAALGDSQTDEANGRQVDGWRTWVPKLEKLLNAQGCNTVGRSFGVAGETSAQMLDRVDDLFFYDTPELAITYGYPNDPANSISTSGTQANVQAIIKALKHKAINTGYGDAVYVAGQANLPATGELGQRVVVLADTSTTGGAAAWHSSQAATVTGDHSGAAVQAVWEWRYDLAGEFGWGRVAVDSTAATLGVPRIMVVGQGYLNYSGGDTPSVPFAGYTGIRSAATAAVAAENVAVGGVASVVFVDLYAFQRARILAGTDPDFSTVSYDQTRSWHVDVSNLHHNAYGHTLVAQAIVAAMPAAWITALSA